MAHFGAATKRGPSQISLEEDMHVFLLRSKDGPKRTQDGAKVAKTILEASGEPSELKSEICECNLNSKVALGDQDGAKMEPRRAMMAPDWRHISASWRHIGAS